MRRNLVIFSIPIVAAFLFFVMSGQLSFSANGSSSMELLSTSAQTTIKITGEASQEIQSDQLTLILNVQTAPAPLNSTSAKSQQLIQKLTDSINSALGPNQSKIKIGQSYLNPFYSGGGAPSDLATFSTYSSVQIKTDLDHYNVLSSKLTEAGFRVEGITIKEIPVDSSKTVTSKISIPQGSSSPSEPPYYLPESITIKSGTAVEWTNNDSAAHTVTGGTPENGPDGSFDSALFMPGTTFDYAFNNEGTYPYFCLVHPWMTGEIVVTKGDVENSAETTYQVNMNVIVETQPDTISNSIKLYQQRFDALKQVLDKAGITADSIKSNQINFNQLYYGSPQYSVYSSNTRIIVNTDIKNADKLFAAVKISGVNVENMMYSVSDTTLDSVRKDLTQKALDDALKKAKEIAEPAGLQIKGIRNVEVNTNHDAPYSGVVTHQGVVLGSVYDNSIYQLGQISVGVTAEFDAAK